jgi:hypothetical protein
MAVGFQGDGANDPGVPARGSWAILHALPQIVCASRRGAPLALQKVTFDPIAVFASNPQCALAFATKKETATVGLASALMRLFFSFFHLH